MTNQAKEDAKELRVTAKWLRAHGRAAMADELNAISKRIAHPEVPNDHQ